jgi:hypothetical protein
MTAPHEQKLKITGPVVVTANRTHDGAVVYLSTAGASEGPWTTDLGRAAVATSAADAGALLRRAAADERNAIGPYAAPVTLGRDGSPRPANLRERIRLAGPTIALPSETVVKRGHHVRL